MQIGRHQGENILFRLLSLVFFVVTVFAVSDCQAQHERGRFKRGSRARVQKRHIFGKHQSGQAETKSRPLRDRIKAATQFNAIETSQYPDPSATHPKYIGGFHSSHFQNIGIPSGDIGLRGNAYHWRPW